MDRTNSAPVVNSILEKVLSGGGLYWPEIGAYNLRGWEIIADVTRETIRTRLKEFRTPVREMGGETWVEPVAFWKSMPVTTLNEEPESCPEKRPAVQKAKGRSTK